MTHVAKATIYGRSSPMPIMGHPLCELRLGWASRLARVDEAHIKVGVDAPVLNKLAHAHHPQLMGFDRPPQDSSPQEEGVACMARVCKSAHVQHRYNGTVRLAGEWRLTFHVVLQRQLDKAAGLGQSRACRPRADGDLRCVCILAARPREITRIPHLPCM